MNIRLLIASLLFATAHPHPGWAAESGTELKDDIVNLETARSAKDINALELAVQRNSAKWRTKDGQSFKEFMFAACRGDWGLTQSRKW